MGNLIDEENSQQSGFYPGFNKIKNGMPQEYGERKYPSPPCATQQIAYGAHKKGMSQEDQEIQLIFGCFGSLKYKVG